MQASIQNLQRYVEREGFKGYDPYDTLNGKINWSRLGKWVGAVAIQVQKRNPINIRGLLGVRKDHNPKGMGLLLQAYSLLYQLEPTRDYRAQMDFLFDWLVTNYSKGYSGYCWGYNFVWANPQKVVQAYHPSIVVSCFVGKGIFAYYQATEDRRALKILQGICDFILNDLPITENQHGICFSYTDIVKDCCFNASMLGAEILIKVYSITKKPELLEYAQRAVDFVMAYQASNGRWNYAIDLSTGEEDRQIDFHQGYVLDSLEVFIRYSNVEEPRYRASLANGAAFYRQNQFFENGQSKWRLPATYPIDIHNQSQGIITFANLANYEPGYLDFAKTIAAWTISNMQDPQGYFYYRKNRVFSNKISYMRWSQAWMLLALAFLSVKSHEMCQ